MGDSFASHGASVAGAHSWAEQAPLLETGSQQITEHIQLCGKTQPHGRHAAQESTGSALQKQLGCQGRRDMAEHHRVPETCPQGGGGRVRNKLFPIIFCSSQSL